MMIDDIGEDSANVKGNAKTGGSRTNARDRDGSQVVKERATAVSTAN